MSAAIDGGKQRSAPPIGEIGKHWGGSALDRHAARPPVGRVEVITLPRLSTAAQNDRDGHETAITCLPQSRWHVVCFGSTRTALQVDAPPVGSVETNSLVGSNATHNDGDAHEMPLNPPAPPSLGTNQRSTRTTDQRRLLGLFDTTTSPPSSTATHNLTDGHETALRVSWGRVRTVMIDKHRRRPRQRPRGLGHRACAERERGDHPNASNLNPKPRSITTSNGSGTEKLRDADGESVALID